MFTGIVEEMGLVARRDASGAFQRLTLRASQVLEDMKIGDSINIDGACQTVVEVDPGHFAVESVEETLRRTTLGELRTGDRVNLERAMRLGDRLGGHLVSGHVEGIGAIQRREEHPHNVVLTVGLPTELARYVAPKGSIALDGISLTVATVSEGAFTVWVIPHTLSHTTLGDRRPGDRVNLETDMIAKYVERLAEASAGAVSPLSEAWLRKMGF